MLLVSCTTALLYFVSSLHCSDSLVQTEREKERERERQRDKKREEDNEERQKDNNFLNNLFYIRSSGAEDKRKEICLRLASSSRYE